MNFFKNVKLPSGQKISIIISGVLTTVIVIGGVIMLDMHKNNNLLTEELESKNKRETELVQQVNSLNKEIKNKKSIIDEKDSLIKEKDSTISSLEDKNSGLEKSTQTLKKENEKLKGQIDQKDKKIRQLQAAKSESPSNSSVSKPSKNNGSSSKPSTNSSSSNSLARTVKATFYTPYDGSATGQTATGSKARPWYTIAVDPRVIPLGTRLTVIGSGFKFTGLAEDTGGAIKGNKIDICVPDRKTAYRLGVKNVQIIIHK